MQLMEHIKSANNGHLSLDMALMHNPDELREFASRACSVHSGALLSLESIMARAYWLQVNGRWIKVNRDA